jgi:L-arabinose isomerase
MHTFSPAKMWINGLKILQKPLLHLHTQFNRDIPWSEIDMDFMNLNQSRPTATGNLVLWCPACA